MKVGIMGLGYVGFPLAVAFCEEGHEVVGPDVDARKVEASEPLEAALDGCDAAVTAHPGLDVRRIVDEAPLVVDFRGVTRGIGAQHLVRL